MNLVFDFGGVVFRWRPEELLRRLLPQHATDAASATHWSVQFFHDDAGDWAAFDRGVVGADELVHRIAARTGLPAADVQHVVDGVPQELQPVPETVALLHALRSAGHRLLYLSNMPAPYARRLVEANHFMAWFDDGVFSSQVHLLKPGAPIFELAQQRFGVPAAALFFLDDTPANVQAAQAAGWQGQVFSSAALARGAMVDNGWL